MYKKIARMRYLIRLFHNMHPRFSCFNRQAMLKEIGVLEDETGCVMSDSPLHPNARAEISKSGRIDHPQWPMPMRVLSTFTDVYNFIGERQTLIQPVIDGIPLKLEYEVGKLLRVSIFSGSRGDVLDCSVGGIHGIPVKIPYQNRLVIEGPLYVKNEAYYKASKLIKGFRWKGTLNTRDAVSDFIAFHGGRRELYFEPFSVLDGLGSRNASRDIAKKLDLLKQHGFSHSLKTVIHRNHTDKDLSMESERLAAFVERTGVAVCGSAFVINDPIFDTQQEDGSGYRADAVMTGY